MFKFRMSIAAAATVLLLVCLHSVSASRDDDCYPWETERGGACYGNLLSYKSPAKAHSSDYVRIQGGLIYSGPITGATPVYGGLPTDLSLLANQAISNMITVLEAAGASRMDILRNPVRSNDVATLSNDPNNALVIRAALAGATHTVYDLVRNGVVNWDKYPSDQERRPPGRSYVIMPNTETIVMVVTAFVGSNRDFVHDYLTEQQTIQFNNLRWDWTTLSPADQQTLENSGFVVTVNGEVQRYHYSSPTSLSYTPNITICDGPGGNNGVRGCRRVALRSCERAFSMMDQATQVLNAAGLVVAGNLRWKGQLYPCTDVINYNGGGARWCRIRDDADIRVAFEIAEAHHINGRENLGFTADDDVLLDLFMTNPDVQYPLFRQFLQRNYPSGKYPAVVINFGRLVGGDKIELTGEHSTGPKRRASSDRRRRVTVASLEGYDTIAVGSEAYGTVHTPHWCNATACMLPPTPLERIRAAFGNALADLQSVGHTGVEGVTRVEVFVTEELYPRPNFPAPAVDMKALTVQVVQELWAPFTLPVVFIEPHRDVYGNYAAQVGGRTVELGNTVQVSLRSVKA